MDTQLRDDLDRCFGDGPPVDDTDRLLDRGRTALRRRRLVEGISALAVAAVVAAGALVTSGTGPGASPDHPPVASSPAAVPAASVSFTVVTDPTVLETLPGQGNVELTSSHQLRVGPGVELRRVVIDPYDPAVYPASVALAYRYDGKTFWRLLYTHSDGSGSGTGMRAADDGDLDAWLSDLVQHPSNSTASVVVDPGLPASDPVMVGADAGLHVAPDVRIVRIVTNPFQRVAPSASTAMIYVRDGEAYWFVVSLSDTGSTGETVPANHGGQSFDEWVADHADLPETPADPEGGLR
jgi:hypothetical protein